MRKSRVLGIESRGCMHSEELVRRFVWGFVKYSSECQILSLVSQISNTTRASRK